MRTNGETTFELRKVRDSRAGTGSEEESASS